LVLLDDLDGFRFSIALSGCCDDGRSDDRPRAAKERFVE
jgi:hypothetical protein